MSVEIINLADAARLGGGKSAGMKRFYENHFDPRLETLKKDATVPNVGDTVRLNDYGLEQVFGTTRGLSRMKTLEMKVTKVDDVSVTYPEATFVVEADNEEINAYLIDHHCFDIVKVA